ncbi:hypothetical protein PC114_g6173 [Phytophthora cactorum]|nr:hypothetical protein PC114_g6173 [Phytophthora cactorum]
MEHPVFANLPPAQQDALNKLMSLLDPEAHLASQGPEAVNARLESFSRYENALLEYIQERMSAATAAASARREVSTRPKPLLVSVKTFVEKDGENRLLWTREVEMTMGSALLQTEQQRAALAIPKLRGRAREWALTCGVDAAFPSWALLKQQLSRVFAPPNEAYRIRSRFLATRQGKKELLDYVQELRTLIAGTAVGPLPEVVTLTVFMEGLCTSAARTEVFRVHPTSFEEAVNVALNAKHSFRSARPGWYAGSAGSSNGPEPMDLSYAEGEEAELLAAEQRTSIHRCFTGGSIRHLRASCIVRNQRKAPPSQASDSSRGIGDSQRQRATTPSPEESWLAYEKSVCKPCLLVVQANVKGFEKPRRVLIDSGASGNYDHRSTLEGSQQYAEALEVRTSDTISARLATGTLVTGLYLDSRYDLILGMAWLERHDPWIDWRSKALGATHFAPGGALVS